MNRIDQRLPDEIVHPVRAGKIVLVLLGALAIAGAVNFALLAWLESREPSILFRVVKNKWELVDKMEKPVECVVTGDSSGLCGVIPGVFEDLTNHSCVNLSTTGSMAALDDAWLLERYVERFGPPGYVVIVHVHGAWPIDIRKETMLQIPMAHGFWEELKPPVEFTPVDEFKLFLDRYAPLYARKNEISTTLKFPWKKPPSNGPLAKVGYYRIDKPKPSFVRKAAKEAVDTLKDKTFEISEANLAALERIKTLAGRGGFRIYIANAPIYKGLLGAEEFKDYYEQVQKRLVEIAEESADVFFVNRDAMAFEADEMENTMHLIYPAAIEYTKKLANEIKELEKKRRD